MSVPNSTGLTEANRRDLSELPPKLLALLAVRCALRVLPLCGLQRDGRPGPIRADLAPVLPLMIEAALAKVVLDKELPSTLFEPEQEAALRERSGLAERAVALAWRAAVLEGPQNGIASINAALRAAEQAEASGVRLPNHVVLAFISDLMACQRRPGTDAATLRLHAERPLWGEVGIDEIRRYLAPSVRTYLQLTRPKAGLTARLRQVVRFHLGRWELDELDPRPLGELSIETQDLGAPTNANVAQALAYHAYRDSTLVPQLDEPDATLIERPMVGRIFQTARRARWEDEKLTLSPLWIEWFCEAHGELIKHIQDWAATEDQIWQLLGLADERGDEEVPKVRTIGSRLRKTK